MIRGRCFSILRNGGRKIRSTAFPSLPTQATIVSNDSTDQRSFGTLSSDPSFVFTINQDYRNTLNTQQRRWKHAHKTDSLKEMAHKPEREAAQERRKKKKARKASKKGGKQVVEAEATTTALSDEEDDDLYFDEDDDDDEILDEDGEPTLPDSDAVESKMNAVIGRFRDSLKSIRGAEPTADMFDEVMVQAYGAATPLNAVAQVVISSPTLAQLTCFDPSVAKDVVKAVQLTLELNPQLEEGGGGNIRVTLPRVSMEVREKLKKSVKKRAESCKQRLRGVRRKAMDIVKKGKDGKLTGVSKDDAFASGKEIEAVSEAATETLNTIVEEKVDSIMEA